MRIPALILVTLLALARTASAVTSDEGPCRGEWVEAARELVAERAASEPYASSVEIDSAGPDEPVEPRPIGPWKMALDDAIHVLSAPIHWSVSQWGLAAASIGTVAVLGSVGDVRLRRAALRNRSGVADDLTRVVEPFGEEYGWAVIGAYGAFGILTNGREARDVAFDATMAALLTGGITDGIKTVVGRARPNRELGAAHFDPFGGDKSFPSGHASHAFAIGAVIAAHSDRVWVKVSAYSLASLVAFSRVYHDAHWSSDVAASALLGTVVGETVVRFNRTLRARGTGLAAYAAPILGDGREGAVLVLVF